MLSKYKETNEYREKFHEYYIQNIEPTLNKFESQRIFRCLQQVIAVIISFTLIIGSMIFLIVSGFNNVDLNVGYNRFIGPICFC